jgi:hypothetical protein
LTLSASRLAAAAVLLAAAAFWAGRASPRGAAPRARPQPEATAAAEKPASRVWQKIRPRPGQSQSLEDRQDRNEAIQSLPYLQGFSGAPADSGVTRHDEASAFAGVNLVTSGHAPEASLVDMKGRTLHTWKKGFRESLPDVRADSEHEEYTTYWRRVHLFPDGALLAIHQLLGLVKLDARSSLVWARAGGFHHDLAIGEAGRIVVLEARSVRLPRINKKEDVLEDFVTVLAPDGTPIESFSLLEAVERSDYAALLQDMKPRGDLFHTNTIKILDGTLSDRLPAFRRGNLLISIYTLDAVAVVDPVAKRVVWALSDLWESQHEPQLLPTGRMLVFDNLGRGGESRVLELDPLTQAIHWQYAGAPAEPFASWKVGSQQRLPNGNTLITESTAGRAFEVTREGRIVWEWVSPYRAGEKRELIATLYEMRRFPPALGSSPWLVPQ